MGYAISWIAVKQPQSEALLQHLGLVPTSELSEYAESLFTGRALSSGWFVLVISKCDHDFIKPGTLESISKIGDVIACSIEEHVMYCSAELWRDGTEVWRVEHDAQQGMLNLSESGSLPGGYAAIKDEFIGKQTSSGGEESDTDYIFDIPLRAARSIAGFKHDEPGPEEDGFTVFKLEAHKPSEEQSKKSRWRFW